MSGRIFSLGFFTVLLAGLLLLASPLTAQTSLTRMSLHEAQLGLIKGQKAISAGQFTEGIAQLTRVLRARALPRDQAAQAFYDRALAYQSLRQYENAARDYSQSLALNTLTGTYRARALYNRGLAQINLGNEKAAMADFNTAITSAPDMPQSYYQRGKLHTTSGQYQQAITDFQTAIAKQMPSSEWAWYELARAQGAMGQWALAQNALNSALKINPNFSEARQQLTIVNNNLQYSQYSQTNQAEQPQVRSSYTDPIVTNSAAPRQANTQQQATGQWDRGGLAPNNNQTYSQIPPTRMAASQYTGATSQYVPGPGFEAARKAAVRPAPSAPQSTSTRGYLMQLSAHNDVHSARAFWTVLYNRNADILGGLSPLIQKTVSAAGKEFYRLRTGPFQKKQDGMTLCQALKARGQDCFVTYEK